jgi:hypothetical protein
MGFQLDLALFSAISNAHQISTFMFSWVDTDTNFLVGQFCWYVHENDNVWGENQ